MSKISFFFTFAFLIAAPSFAASPACVSFHEGIGFDAESAKSRCEWKERREIIKTEAFKKCRANIAAVSKDTTIPMICFSADVAAAISSKPGLASCIADSTRSLNDGFWYQEDFVLAQEYQRPVVPLKISKKGAHGNPAQKIPAQPFPTFFQDRVLKACIGAAPVQKPVGARVLGQMHVHTYAPQKGGVGPIGGFSDLVADGEGSLMAVSDDLQSPSLGFFDWSISGDGAVTLKYRENRGILTQEIVSGKDPQIDLEAMDVLENGDLVLATEISPRLKDLEIDYPNTFLMRVGADGAWKEGISLRSEFIPYFDKRAVKCTRMHRMLKKPCVEYFQVSGFAHNKGVEALTLNGKKTHLVYVTEQPLFDPANSPVEPLPGPKGASLIAAPPRDGNVLLSAQSLANPKEITTYDYPLSLENDNGVVALRHLRERTYLALERGFNTKAGEAVVRIFRVDLPKAAGQSIVKTLVLDLASLKPSFTRGFESVDNFEGLAIGPRTANGTVLFLVSDNNFNVSQRTMLLALELSKELLP